MSRPRTWMLLVSVTALSLGWNSRADAQISTTAIQVEQGPSSVTIRIDNMKVEHNMLATRGDKIFIDVPDVAAGQQLRLSDDKTVKMVEISEGSHSRLTVQLRHGRDKTKEIGMAATIENIGNGVVLHVPRWPIQVEEKVASRSSEPVVAETPAPTEPKTESSEIPSPTAAATLAASEPLLPQAPGDDKAIAAGPVTGTGESGSGSSLGLIIGVLLLLGGGAVFAWRARQQTSSTVEAEDFRIVATKQLGGKSKVVWLSAGDRDMIVAVGDSGTQLLSEWNRTAPQLPGATGVKIAPTLMDMQKPVRSAGTARSAGPAKKSEGVRTVYDFQASLNSATHDQRTEDVFRAPNMPSAAASGNYSPAVAGLIKMRDQAPPVNVDVATNDEEADAEWARELLKATRDTMFRRMG